MYIRYPFGHVPRSKPSVPTSSTCPQCQKGVQREAIKFDPYSVRETRVESTLLAFNPKTVDDWRKRGFFSVTEERLL